MFVCFVCWLELDSYIALYNSSSLYNGLFWTIVALNQTWPSTWIAQFLILPIQITKFKDSINPRIFDLYVFQNNLHFFFLQIFFNCRETSDF